MKFTKIFYMIPACVFCAVSLSAADEGPVPVLPRQELAGFIFNVRDASIVSPVCLGKTSCSGGDALVVTFEMVNDSSTRKVDYERPFKFTLRDEFGNVYRSVPQPKDFSGTVFEPGKNFPSIYPGEHFRQKLFFEKPVETSRRLILTVKPELKGAPETVDLALPPVRRNLPPLSRGRMPKEKDLRIETLLPEKTVRPGQSVPFRIILSGDLLPPEKIFLFLPRSVYEDEKLLYQYRVNISADQPPGELTIVVMAKWGDILNGATVSKSFTLNVEKKTKPM